MPTDPRPSPDELIRAGDPATLLAGEDPASIFVADAVHWIRVYEELIALKDSLLVRLAEMAQGLSNVAVEDTEIDERFLRAQADRYRTRHHYWTVRAAQLASGEAGARTVVAAPAGASPAESSSAQFTPRTS
ncbi:MAG TPA: hypothetical protein VG520_00345 [Candidatus Dormibacteraeota bacterium]|nr:hypothetical protein [Candidatus Dormibacteraeota bacterium]